MFLLTEKVGQFDEYAYEVPTSEIVEFTEKFLNAMADGEAVQIRRADYLDSVRHEKVTSFLRVIQGGKS